MDTDSSGMMAGGRYEDSGGWVVGAKRKEDLRSIYNTVNNKTKRTEKNWLELLEEPGND